jgi:sugar phosphate isomerase/epimerase
MKDVALGLARQVQSGRLTYTEAVRNGMYRPLGGGDVDIAAIVGHLRGQGYDGWYVLEQDTILTEKNPGARARWPTCTPAPNTSGGRSAASDDRLASRRLR